jgi:hypothetical protein
MSNRGALADVEIYLEEDFPAKNRKLISKSDANGKFDIVPNGHSHSCFLITCMGDPGIRGSYVFKKTGYRPSTFPYNFFSLAVTGKNPPELSSKEVLLQPDK